MRTASLVLASVLVLSLVALPDAVVGATSGESHDLTVEFVAFDAKAKTVTFKDDKGEQKTAPVMESAMGDFKEVKAGEKVVLTCADDEDGEHQGVSKAKLAMAKKS